MKNKKSSRTTFTNDLYVKAYRLASGGLPNKALARALGVSVATLKRWMEEDGAFKRAIRDARKSLKGDKEETFLEYCYNRMDPSLKWLWDRILASEDDPDEALWDILRGQTDEVRMNLFLHALQHYNFNASEACRSVGVTVAQFEKWLKEFPDFKKLYKEMHFHKKNLYEGALVKQVKRGDSHAIVYVNKTFNRDRGYNDKITIEHQGEVKHTVRLKDLDLSLEDKLKILEKFRAHKAGEPLKIEDHSKDHEVMDADFEEVKPKEKVK